MKEIIGIIITGIFAVLVAYMNRRNNHRKKEINLLPPQENEPENEETEPEMEEETYQEEPKKDVIIFILDDNPDDIRLVVRVIKNMGERYETFTNKDTYLEEIPNTANVHIIDHYLTSGYGWEILIELKKRNKSNFVILYSGTQDKTTLLDYTPYKINEVVYKDHPDVRKLLEAAIQNGLNEIRRRS